MGKEGGGMERHVYNDQTKTCKTLITENELLLLLFL